MRKPCMPTKVYRLHGKPISALTSLITVNSPEKRASRARWTAAEGGRPEPGDCRRILDRMQRVLLAMTGAAVPCGGRTWVPARHKFAIFALITWVAHWPVPFHLMRSLRKLVSPVWVWIQRPRLTC